MQLSIPQLPRQCPRPGCAALCLGLSVLACTPHQVTRRPAPPIPVPARYVDKATEGAPERDGPWWHAFGDPRLNALVRRALQRNFNLQAAWARLSQAEALLTQAKSGRYPTLRADVSASRQRIATLFGAFENSLYSTSLAASYEVDLFGRVRAGVEAAKLDAAAMRDDVESMAMSLTAEIAESYFALAEAEARRRFLEEQLRTNTTYLELITLRFREGLTSSVDVYQQQQQVEALRAELATAALDSDLRRNQLAILVGRPHPIAETERQTELPAPPPLPARGLPAALLERRPDVRAARRRAEAGDHRVAQAIAARYPSLRIDANVGLSANAIESLLESFVWGVVGSLATPLFDGGRLKAEVRRQRAVLRERMALYGQSLVQAMKEVYDALALERGQRDRQAALKARVAALDGALRETQARYREGLSDYLPVLVALGLLQQVQVSLLASERQLLSSRIQLYRALGGRWTASLRAPTTQ
ncbi:MAG: efflux transporter outer membrane subunit [Polyangiales bacterium]